ncbi:MAG: LamB/YcsF family protein [Planctomycetota bacterium]|jgi:UPF0271 protein
MPYEIDLNCDMGEGFGLYTHGQDEAMMPSITSANVACGFHAGDPTVMRKTVEGAREHGVRVGAHIGYPDRMGFGRRAMTVSPRELIDYTVTQLGALGAHTGIAGLPLHHMKPHGALYMAALEDEATAQALADAVAAFDDSLLIYTIRDSALWQTSLTKGLRPVAEFFADRPYFRDGRVKMFDFTPEEVGADAQALAARAVQLVMQGEIDSFEGGVLPLTADTICIHSDTPNAPEILQAVRAAFSEQGISTQVPSSSQS